MGHVTGKDVYGRLGRKLDGLTVRLPWSETLHEILREIFSPDEADVVVKMPCGPSNLRAIQRATQIEEDKLRKILDGASTKGLVVDVWADGEYYYMPSPFMAGLYEFTMMRTDGRIDSAKAGKLFHRYFEEKQFLAANAHDRIQIAVTRTFPHEEAIHPDAHLEVLDYERASALVDRFDKFAIGLCACRHEMDHLGERKCQVPLESCLSFGIAADFFIRRGLQRPATREEIRDNFARSKEMGLVFNADNVQRNIQFLCQCCACCCHPLRSIREYGYPHLVVSSTYLAQVSDPECTGCGKCAVACPIEAIRMQPDADPMTKRKRRAEVDSAICLGCGVCALKCKTQSLKLVKRGQRVIHPETTFHRIILQALEKGNLQNFIVRNPEAGSQKFMGAVMGAFFRLDAVKRALMSDTLRSHFLKAMESGMAAQGMAFVAKI